MPTLSIARQDEGSVWRMMAVENCLAFFLKVSLSALVKLAILLHTVEKS